MSTRTKVVIVILSLIIVALIVLENLALRVIFPEVVRDNLALQIIAGLLLAVANAAVALTALALASLRREQKNEEERIHYLSHLIHQLRTPLTTVRWGLDLLEKERGALTQEEFSRITNELQTRNDEAIRAVNDVLTATRLESAPRHTWGEITPHLAALIDEVSKRFAIPFQRKKITPQITLEPGTPRGVKMAPSDVKIILENLLENAVLYTPEGGRVTIALKPGTLGTEISVTDTGIGIPQTALDRIGQKFFRAQNAIKSVPHGTGLGLFIIRKLLASHHGHFKVESEEGKGTKFTVIIPSI